MSIEEGRAVLRRADARFGHRWWAPAGYVAVLVAVALAKLVRAWFR